MLALIRISLPDRPGSLGRLTSALGTAGADIQSVDVLESEGGRALDDVTVTVRDLAHLAAVTVSITSLAGMDLVGVRSNVPPVSGHADLQLVEQVISRPGSALRTLVDGAPRALGADWAALLEYAGDLRGVVLRSDHSPDDSQINPAGPLRLASVDLHGPRVSPSPPSTGPITSIGGCALVPLGRPDPTDGGVGLGLLLARDSGFGFHRSELWRLGQFGHVLAVSLGATSLGSPAANAAVPVPV